MKMVGMLRVKNEARWIERCIGSILPLCDRVIVLDDHSTDDTVSLCAAMPNVTVLPSPFRGLNESRDKNYLLEQVEPLQPEWIMAIDGDEMLASGSESALLQAMQGPHTCLSPRILYLWDSEDQTRVDGVYGDFHRESLFRFVPGSWFAGSGDGANFHCGNVPMALRQKRHVLNDVVLLHFGYMHRADRERKYAWYNTQDANNLTEDRYRHMVIGDLFPAESKFMHGGPLTLNSIHH